MCRPHKRYAGAPLGEKNFHIHLCLSNFGKLFQNIQNSLINLRSISFTIAHSSRAVGRGIARAAGGGAGRAAVGGALPHRPSARCEGSTAARLCARPIAHATHWTPGKAGSRITFKIVVLSIFPALYRAYVNFTHPICVNMKRL